MLQRLGIRGKILAVVAVPVLVLLLAAGYITYSAASSFTAASNAEQLVDTAKASQPFQADLDTERDAGTMYVAAYSKGITDRGNSRAVIANQEALLPENVVADLNEIYDTAGSMSLDDARALGPSAVDAEDPASWPQWPSSDEVTEATTAIRAVSDEVEAYSEDLSGDAADAVGSIAFQLQTEATNAENWLTETPQFEEAFRAATPETDTSYSPFGTRLGEIADSEENAAVLDSAGVVEQQMEQIELTRDTVRRVSNTASDVSGDYDRIASSVNGLLERFSLAVADPTLSLQLTAYAAMDELFRQLGLEHTQNARILRAGDWAAGELDAARSQVNRTDFARNDAESAVDALGTDLVVPAWGASQSPSSTMDFQSVRRVASGGDRAALATIRDVAWSDMVAAEAEAQRPAYDGTVSMAAVNAESLRSAALFQTAVTALAAVVVIVLSVVIALLIARRIVVPLRRLTTTATAVRAELPRLVERVAMPGETVDVAEVQIPVESRDEVGRLAEAFNGVNAATLAIASEQAALRGSISEMFVNVARRDQVLLNRQLASIDDMERTQDDPETLTKLFALDHLATRMRRNSESLLVLAGIDTGRRLRRSMPLSDVIRTASSEIELYERVQLELDTDPAMLGHSALTAAHLFAELLENATVFSDPGSPVIVRTGERDGAYVVEIQDSGIGMNESELAEANSRVASTAASEILGAQRLGLFVVGRIARRIGARVAIESTEGAGTTAVVTMTPSLFDSTYAADVVHHTESTVNEALHVPAALVSHATSDEQLEAPAAAVEAYQPAVVESAPLVARTPVAEPSVNDLIAADAAAAPAGEAVNAADLTAGVSAMGLPTRRRREASVEVSAEEQSKIIGLPARATDEQLSALEAAAPDEGFTPAIPASEISPQTPEDRAQMFRGFRSRRDLADAAPEVDPEAESLGHAARREGLAPEDIVPAQPAFVVPDLEEDDLGDDLPAVAAEEAVADVPALEEDDAAFGADLAVPVAAAAMVVPLLEDDEDDIPVAVAPVDETEADASAAPAADEPADVPVAIAEEATQPVAEAEPELVAPEAAPEPAPFGYADVYGSLAAPAAAPEPEQPAWGVDSVSLAEPSTEPEPTLDELIAGATDEEAAKSGFFSRLFGRSKKDKGAAVAAAAVVAATTEPEAPAFEPGPEPEAAVEAEPTPDVVPIDEPAFVAPAFEPAAEPAAFEPEPAPVPAAFEPEPTPVAFEPAPAAFEPEPVPASEEPVSPGGAFALWTDHRPVEEPAPVAAPEPAAEMPAVGQAFTPDELANPFGWESAGASALAANEPEAAIEYQPILDSESGADGDGPAQAEITSEVFSELSSLSAQRPKVETTRAGLQRRRSADAPAPEVKPIEQEVQLAHKERDADEVRSRFSSFYSGTQRARSDVAEFEQRSQSAVTKE